MLVISTQNWSILAKFAKKNPTKLAFFYWLFLGEVSPWNFPWNRPLFLRICPWKSFEFWLFSCENPAKSADFPANLPLKIPRNFAFFSAKYQKPCLYQQILNASVIFKGTLHAVYLHYCDFFLLSFFVFLQI